MLCVYILLILCSSNFCLSEESDRSLFPPLPVAPVTSKNELCKADSVTYLENLDNMTLWSYQMWDANAKSTTSLLQGNKFHMGDWNECMKAKAPFKTRFCLIVIKANITDSGPIDDPRTIGIDPQGSVLKRILQSQDAYQLSRDDVRIGWCVPASCTNENLNDVLDDHFNRYNIPPNVTYSGVAIENLCQTQGEVKSFNALDFLFCVVLTIFVCIVITATLYELKTEKLTEKEKQEHQTNLGYRILIGFSAKKNFIDLARADETSPALSSLYGIRIISIFMIILSHKVALYSSGPVLNFDDIETGFMTTEGSVVFQVVLFVDTFFVISGILVTYGLMKQYEKKYRSPFYNILSRYMRLTPAYAFVIFYYVTLFNHTGTGPLWKASVQQESEDCKNNWWTNLLYVNNYVNADHICMLQSWYLACDYHYYIIAIFVVLLFLKNKILGSVLFILWSLLSIAVPFIVTVVHTRPGLLIFYPDFFAKQKRHPDALLTYVKSYSRATPYCLGMMMGYVYYKMKDKRMSLSKLRSHSITLISILLLLVGAVSCMPFYSPYHKYNALEAGIYAGFNRLAWSFGTVGILLTASFGHATVIQKILSWSPFVPLSKLVYGAYLIHMSVQFRSLGMTLTPQRFDIFTLICITIGDCFVSLVGGLVLYLLIEIPMMKLYRELTNSPKPVTSTPESNSVQESVNSNSYIQKKVTGFSL